MRSPKFAFLLLTFIIAAPASAQRLLDLQVRGSAVADALAPGAIAVFWNPAATAGFAGRAEALVVDVRGAAATGVDGLALAGAFRLDSLTSVAFGYLHVGIDGIGRTSTSPLEDPGAGDIAIGEDVFGAALARGIGEAITLGAILRYAHTAEITGGEGLFEWGLGAVYRTTLPLAPVVAAAARAEDDGANWTAGVEVAPPLRLQDWQFRASWGVGGSPQVHGATHRVSALASWRDQLLVTAGAAGEPDGEARSWQPLASASLRLSRFSIGVLREELPNDFGAIHSLRFSVAFQ